MADVTASLLEANYSVNLLSKKQAREQPIMLPELKSKISFFPKDIQILRVIPHKIDGIGSPTYQIGRKVDEVLSEMDNLRNQVILSLIENPEEFMAKMWILFLSRDVACKFKMGSNLPTIKERLEGNVNPLTSNIFFKCKGCMIIESMTSIENTLSCKIFSPECGEAKHLKYSICKQDQVSPKVTKTNQQHNIIRQIIGRNQLARACQAHLPILARARYYSLDPFSNRLIITWYLEKVLEKTKIPHLRKIYYGFICGSNGYLLMEEDEYLKFSDLQDISQQTVWSILYQLFGLFHRLRNYDLSFHTIDDNTIIIEETPCRYEYDEIMISGDITLKINDLSDAGITVSTRDEAEDRIRIYRSSSQPEKRFDGKSFKSIDWGKHYELSSSPGEIPDSWVSYKVSDTGLEQEQRTAFLYANRMGLPLYQSSFDIYRLMLLLASNQSIYQILTEDPKLSKIWKSFWVPSEYSMVQDRISSHQICLQTDTTSLDECSLATILTGLNLRCDIVDHVWSSLKNYATGK